MKTAIDFRKTNPIPVVWRARAPSRGGVLGGGYH
jgi:hypothetical protein